MTCRLSMLLLATLATLCSGSLFAAEAPVAGAPLSDPELESARGGFLVAGNVAFEFGAVVRTYAAGALALQTNVTWAGDGPRIEQMTGAGVSPVAGPGASGFSAYSSASGVEFAHILGNGQIASLLSNASSDQTYRQETDVTLTLPGFQEAQRDMNLSRVGARLSDDIAIGAVLIQGR